MNLFDGTGVKRYALRFRARPWNPWEYPPGLQFDTLEEAQEAFARLGRPKGYELAERFLSVRYSAEAEYTPGPLLDRVLKLAGLRPYMLLKEDGRGWWRACIDKQFDTAEAARQAAGDGLYRVAAAVLVGQCEPVREGVHPCATT